MNQKLPEPYDLNIGQITKALDQNVKQLRVRRDIKRDLKKLNNKIYVGYNLSIYSI